LADSIETEACTPAGTGEASSRRVVDPISVGVNQAARTIGVGRGPIYAMLHDGRLAWTKVE
jgi:hypothetical protein